MHTVDLAQEKGHVCCRKQSWGAGLPRSFGSQIIPSPDLQGTVLQDLVLILLSFRLPVVYFLLIMPSFLSFEMELFILCHILKVCELVFICRGSPLITCVSEEILHFLLNSVGIIKDNNIYLLL